MSRAFVKEDGPEDSRLPDLPLSPHPNYVTPRGLGLLLARQTDLQAALAALRARPSALDSQARAALERDLRYVEARLRCAIPVTPDPDPQEVAFGLAVTVQDEAGRSTTWTIVGEDEADPARHLIAAHSPLARALLVATAGDEVPWPRGSLTILSLRPA